MSGYWLGLTVGRAAIASLANKLGSIASLSSLGKTLFPWLAGNVAEGFGLQMFLPYVIILAVAMVACWLMVLTRSVARSSRFAP
ncbi:hypothetical protein [Dactylococcopsis salina]|uniref:Uncharacterized protein n=1 Tax=Dactylococcopsis salina (strain PCC 8305) TaxID=13035 RepID=K9YXS0_DACS8|nr:hypothetical protein [Dactylococcopsis salina]AFZ50913.1 hypothetical protein Dacsa_2299 [Dactylococcopsis salina PCC 8305]